jgi:hypothetical protein
LFQNVKVFQTPPEGVLDVHANAMCMKPHTHSLTASEQALSPKRTFCQKFEVCIDELGIGLCRNSHYFRKFSHFYLTLFNHFSSLHHTLCRNSMSCPYLATLCHHSTLHFYAAPTLHRYRLTPSHHHCLVSLHVTSQVIGPSRAIRSTTP